MESKEDQDTAIQSLESTILAHFRHRTYNSQFLLKVLNTKAILDIFKPAVLVPTIIEFIKTQFMNKNEFPSQKAVNELLSANIEYVLNHYSALTPELQQKTKEFTLLVAFSKTLSASLKASIK